MNSFSPGPAAHWRSLHPSRRSHLPSPRAHSRSFSTRWRASSARWRSSQAFTLVEMLVSVSVLILIMTFVTQMLGSAQTSTTLSTKHLDADAEARLVFDRMAVDFARMPRRPDVDTLFSKQDSLSPTNTGSNDKMFFYAEAPAFFSGTTTSTNKSPVSLVGYCINSDSTNALLPAFTLLRLSKGLTWDQPTSAPGTTSSNGGLVFLSRGPAPAIGTNGTLVASVRYPPDSTDSAAYQYPAPYVASTIPGNLFWRPAIGTAPDFTGSELQANDTGQTDFDVIADGVLRMEFCYQVKDLTYPASPRTTYSNYPIAHFTKNVSVNSGTAINDYPSTSPVNLTSMSVGDRWYDTKHCRAFACSGFVMDPTKTPSKRLAALWEPIGLSDVTAIVVTIAILDTSSRKQIPNALSKVSEAFLDPQERELNSIQANPSSTDLLPHLPAERWMGVLTSSTSSFATKVGIPTPTAAQIRVYQRYFYLNN